MLNIGNYGTNFSNYKRQGKPNISKVNFTGALTTQERKVSNILLEMAWEPYANLRAAIIPGPANPAYTMGNCYGGEFRVDTGVGSSNSKSAKDHLIFMKDLMGFNMVQNLPDGALTAESDKMNEDLSPFSGSPFTKGSQTIDPGWMQENGLVSVDDIKKYNVPDSSKNPLLNDYDNYFAKENEFFTTAYEKFLENKKLQAQYKEFEKHPVYSQWLDRMAISSSLVENIYGTDSFQTWKKISTKANTNCNLEMQQDLDQKLFDLLDDGGENEKNALARIAEIKADPACKKTMDFYKFKQFLAYTQAKEKYDFSSSKGIKIIADVPIGVSRLEPHIFPKAFMFDLNAKKSRGSSTLACPMSVGTADWGVAALKPNSEDSAKFIKLKYRTALETADTVRIDAAWQLVMQMVRHEYDDNSKDEWKDMGDKLLVAVTDAFKDAGKEKEIKNIVAENLGFDEEGRISKTKAILDRFEIPEIVHGVHGIPNDAENKWITPGIHDHKSMKSLQPNYEDRIDTLAGRYIKPTIKRIQMMFTDAFGRAEAYNDPDEGQKLNDMPETNLPEKEAKAKAIKNRSAWKPRQAENYEETYYRGLAGDGTEKTGFNAFKALKRAMQWNNDISYPNGNLTAEKGKKAVAELLQYFESAVEEKNEIYATKDADTKGSNLLAEKFGQKAVDILLGAYESLGNKNAEDKKREYQKIMINVEDAINEHVSQQPHPANTDATMSAVQNAENNVQSAVKNASKKVADNSNNGLDFSALKSNKNFMAIGLGTVALGGAFAIYKKMKSNQIQEQKIRHKNNAKNKVSNKNRNKVLDLAG